MATGTNGIATRANANSVKSGSYTSDLSRCIKYSDAIAVGLGVYNADRYTSNTTRLVRYSDLYLKQTYLTFKFTINISSDDRLYNKGPITLYKTPSAVLGAGLSDSTPISYVREVEATEVESEGSGIPLEYSNTHDEESEETSMSLSTVDEVLQVAKEFEEQEQILKAPSNPVLKIGVTLTKGDSQVSLLDTSAYGPSPVFNKTVEFTIYSKAYSSADAGTYMLRYVGSNLLKNNDGLYPSGGLYESSSSSNRYQTITVNSAGTYTFSAYWKKDSSTPDPSIPSTSYTFRLRFKLSSTVPYQVKISFTCSLYGSYETYITQCSKVNAVYTYAELPKDMVEIDGTTQYCYIDLWTGDSIPSYVNVTNYSFSVRSNPYDNWRITSANPENARILVTGTSLPTSGTNYSTKNPHGNYYSMDYTIS